MKILIVAHDSGGAEITSAWALTQPDNKYAFVLEGPAVGVVKKRFPSAENLPRLALNKLDGFDLVLTGSSWSSDLERVAINSAIAQRVKVATYLDHWTFFAERFAINAGSMQLPNEVWVGDEYALEIANKVLIGVRIKFIRNAFFEEVRSAFQGITSRDPNLPKRILYVTEPIDVSTQGKASLHGYTEFDAMKGYLSYLGSAIQQGLEIEKLRVRLHPSESSGKYADLISKFGHGIPIEDSIGTSILEDCAWADIVVGCETMAMVIALLAGKKVFSVVPAQGKRPSLPHQDIEWLFHKR